MNMQNYVILLITKYWRKTFFSLFFCFFSYSILLLFLIRFCFDSQSRFVHILWYIRVLCILCLPFVWFPYQVSKQYFCTDNWFHLFRMNATDDMNIRPTGKNMKRAQNTPIKFIPIVCWISVISYELKPFSDQNYASVCFTNISIKSSTKRHWNSKDLIFVRVPPIL